MGQCYSVEGKFIFKNNDPSRFCETIREEIAKRNGKTAYFDDEIEKLDLTKPFDCFRAVTSVDNSEEQDGVMLADFSASYGWYIVMRQIFNKALTACTSESYARIHEWG